jgi:hypothetical protein
MGLRHMFSRVINLRHSAQMQAARKIRGDCRQHRRQIHPRLY